MSHWAERFGAARLLYERLNTYAEFVEEPQAQAMDLISWLPQPGLPFPAPAPNIVGLAAFVPGSAKARSPMLGEHSAAILAEHGYGAAEIAGLIAGRVITAPARVGEKVEA
jgi:crotonobetainyl-CoA:carnitine CoA-transferase CaiB-like acyl-CoA transferase